MQVIDRYTIERSGERNTEELLRNQPVANANGVPTSGNAGDISGQGASSISLRGFDPGATLVLLDGHRMVSHPSGTNGGTEFFVDLNTIPRAAIESVEILKDGASTTYGADAVAGVVNIKLRHNYQGAEAYAEYGNSTDTDSGETAASIVFGVGDNNTHLSGVANYYRRNSIYTTDRDYDRKNGLPPIATANSEPYNLELSRAAVVAAGGNPPLELGDTFFGHAPFFSNGTAPASSYVYTEAPSAHFPINHFAGELPDTERYGAFIMADHKIFGDQMVAYGDVFFERDDVRNDFGPAPTVSFQPENGVTIAIPRMRRARRWAGLPMPTPAFRQAPTTPLIHFSKSFPETRRHGFSNLETRNLTISRMLSLPLSAFGVTNCSTETGVTTRHFAIAISTQRLILPRLPRLVSIGC